MAAHNLVIVGGGVAGVSAAEAARKQDPEARITLLSQDSDFPVYRLRVAEVLKDPAMAEKLYLHPAEWYAERKIDVRLGVHVEAIDPAAKAVRTHDGRVFTYDRLVYATGSYSFVPPVKGCADDSCFTLWSLESALRLTQAIDSIPVRTIAIIGGGLLGLEAAWQLYQRGVRVKILERSPGLLSRQLDEASSQLLENYIHSLGIGVITNANCTEMVRRDAPGGLKCLQLEDGRKVECDAVLFSVGVRANTDIAAAAGLEIGRRLKVDARMQTSDPDVFSAGDVCEVDDGYWFGLWAISKAQGAVAGANAVGGDKRFEKVIPPYVVNTMKTRIVSQGNLPAKEEEGIRFSIETDSANYSYRKKVYRGGKLAGFILLGDAAKEMLALQKELS